jgi:predicted acetyltransferase
VKPSLEFESAYMDMRADFEHDAGSNGFTFKPMEPGGFAEHVAKLQAQERGEGLPEGFVPQTTFWLVRNEETILGEIRLRHTLTPSLEQVGGHIGYGIRPSERGRGYATAMLRLVLKEAKKLGLKRVLLTCEPDNVASSRVMIKNRAVQGTDSVNPETGKPHSRYWIRL